ncbi:MAG: hypothetical protein SGPRY_005939 [Prymnesium sp.]
MTPYGSATVIAAVATEAASATAAAERHHDEVWQAGPEGEPPLATASDENQNVARGGTAKLLCSSSPPALSCLCPAAASVHSSSQRLATSLQRSSREEGGGTPSTEGLVYFPTLPTSAGPVLCACAELLGCCARPCDRMKLSAQYVQIFEERVVDLVGWGQVVIRGSEVGGTPYLLGAAHVRLESLDEALSLLRRAEARKHVGSTLHRDERRFEPSPHSFLA